MRRLANLGSSSDQTWSCTEHRPPGPVTGHFAATEPVVAEFDTRASPGGLDDADVELGVLRALDSMVSPSGRLIGLDLKRTASARMGTSSYAVTTVETVDSATTDQGAGRRVDGVGGGCGEDAEPRSCDRCLPGGPMKVGMAAGPQEGVETAMTVELVRLVLRAVAAVAPNWILWLGATSFVAVAGTLLLFYERCRRRTYVAVLEVIQPGTFLLGGTHRRGGLKIVRLPRSSSMVHRCSVDSRV